MVGPGDAMKSVAYIADDAKKALYELERMNLGDAKELLNRVIAGLTSHPLIYVTVDDEKWAKDMKQAIEDARKSE